MADAEIIAVGSELLTPQKIDTNSLYLTGELNALGVEVVRKTIVGDDRERLTDTIRGAVARSHIVLVTGGLGPTEDDVTRDAAAAALDRGLHFDEEICRWLEDRFRRFGRKMAENNKRQAYIVDGAGILPNQWGTAPGQWIEQDGVIVILLPGPPRELKAMFAAECLSRLERTLPAQAIRTRFYRVAGMGESDLDTLIAPVYTRYQNPATTILAAAGDIQIHLRARCATEQESEALLEEVGLADPADSGRAAVYAGWRPARTGGRRFVARARRVAERGRERDGRHAGRAHHVGAWQFGLLSWRLSHLHE